MAIRRYDTSSAVEERELSRGAHRIIYPPVEKIRVVEVDTFPSLGTARRAEVRRVGAEEPRRGRGAPDREDAGVFHQVGPPPAGKLGAEGRADAAGGIRRRLAASAGAARPLLRPDRRVLPDGLAPAQQLPPLRERILHRRVRLRSRARPPDRRDLARAPRREDDGGGVPRQRRRPVAARTQAPRNELGADAEGRDQPGRRVLHGLRSQRSGRWAGSGSSSAASAPTATSRSTCGDRASIPSRA